MTFHNTTHQLYRPTQQQAELATGGEDNDKKEEQHADLAAGPEDNDKKEEQHADLAAGVEDNYNKEEQRTEQMEWEAKHKQRWEGGEKTFGNYTLCLKNFKKNFKIS